MPVVPGKDGLQVKQGGITFLKSDLFPCFAGFIGRLTTRRQLNTVLLVLLESFWALTQQLY